MGSYQQAWVYNDGYTRPPPGANGPPLYNTNPQRKIANVQAQSRSPAQGLSLPTIFGIVFVVLLVAGTSLYLFAFGGIDQIASLFAPTPPDTFISVTFLSDSSIPINVRNTAEAAFLSAAQRWTEILGNTVVTSIDVSGETFGSVGCTFEDDLGGGQFALVDPGPFPENVLNKVHIAARIAPDDGVGNTLGFAGPCGVVSEIPASGQLIALAGRMSFDSDDIGSLIADGELEDVILHEMGHVLGIGTLWNFAGNGLLQDPVFSGNPVTGNPNNDPQFVGANAVAEHIALGESGNVPVEDGTFRSLSDAQIIALQGRGSIDGHWRETIFRTELMTPSIGGNNNPLSRMTIASLEDLGYAVNQNAADAYAVPRISSEGGPALAKSSGHKYVMVNDIYIEPTLEAKFKRARESRDRSSNLIRGSP